MKMSKVFTLGSFTFTHEELEAAFNKVCDPKDWRNPIRAEVVCPTFRDRTLIEAAILFYVGEPPVICFDAGCEYGPTRPVVFVSRGYRAGPAGP
jgi:hypothetical protein